MFTQDTKSYVSSFTFTCDNCGEEETTRRHPRFIQERNGDMNNEQKIEAIFNLITDHTMPKEQLGFYSEKDLWNDIAKIINS